MNGPSKARVGRAGALLVTLLALVSGCGPSVPIEGQVQTPVPPIGAGGFRVGAARVDLTPIPGIPMSYSLFAGKVSRGFWTRLWARAIYAEDAGGHAFVLVAAELPAIPNGLRDRVAQLVRDTPGMSHLGRTQIVLAATHTHHGPQNYFSSTYYNSMPSPRMGFDPQLFEFLAGRIRKAIVEAATQKKPAGEVRYRQAKLGRFFRNRSVAAFRLDADRDAFVATNASIPDDCQLVEGETDPLACRAVRAIVEVVEFWSADQLIASAVFLAAHPTVMSPDTEVFSGDLFGVTATLLEQGRLASCAGYTPSVVAVFNGAEGDASVTWSEGGRDRLELEDHATRLAELVCGKDPGLEPSDTDVYTDPDIHSVFEWPLELAGRSVSGQPCSPWHEGCTATRPVAGAPSMGGAQDGRTLWFDAGIKAGLRTATRSEDGRKAVGVNPGGYPLEISSILAEPDLALEKVPLAVHRLGGLVIATLPGEFTTMMESGSALPWTTI